MAAKADKKDSGGEKDGKNKALGLAVEQIEKQFGKGSISARHQ